MGVRYGHTAEIGSRRVMEDRTIAVVDIFKADVPNSLRSRSEAFFSDLLAASSAPSSGALVLPPPPPSPPGTRLVAAAASAGRDAKDGQKRRITARLEAAASATEVPSTAVAVNSPGDGADASDAASAANPSAAGSLSAEGGGSGANNPGIPAEAVDDASDRPVDRSCRDEKKCGEDDFPERERQAFLATSGNDDDDDDKSGHEEGGAKRDRSITAVADIAAAYGGTEGENGGHREVGTSDQAEQQKPRPGLSAAFFGVYDGHDGDVVAEALQQSLHKLIAKQV